MSAQTNPRSKARLEEAFAKMNAVPGLEYETPPPNMCDLLLDETNPQKFYSHGSRVEYIHPAYRKHGGSNSRAQQLQVSGGP